MANTYQLSLLAENLKGVSMFRRRPATYAQVTVLQGPGTVLGRTEVHEPSNSPDWCTCFKLEFNEAVICRFKVSIYECTAPSSGEQPSTTASGRNSTDKMIAEAEFEATEVFQSPGHRQYKDSAKGAKIYADLQSSVQGQSKGRITLHFRGLDMKNVEPGLLGLGRSDPFFVIAKKNSDHAIGVVRWNTVYRSEHIHDNLNPHWEPFHIGLEELCYCDLDWPLKITVYDYEKSGKHQPIGEFEVTTQKLIEHIAVKGNADRDEAFQLILDEKVKVKGLLCVLKAELQLETY